MEKDDEIKGEGNSINYEARMQDTRVGRFLSLDPLSNKFPWYSPYQFAGNTPIQAIDLDGAEEYHYTQIKDDTGKVVGLKQISVVDIYEWQWNPHKDPESTVGFYLWERVKNPRKEIYVHEKQWLPIASGMGNKWQEYDCVAECKSLDEAKQAKGDDFHPPQMYFIQVGLEAAADEHRSGRVPGKGYNRFVRRSNGNLGPKIPVEKESVTITRVQSPHKLSQRISVDGSGNVKIKGSTQLFITIDDENHATYYYNKKGASEGGATITSFKVTKDVADEIRKMAVPQKQGKAYPDRPQQVDVTKSKSSYGLPAKYIEKLKKGVVPGSGKVKQPKS